MGLRIAAPLATILLAAGLCPLAQPQSPFEVVSIHPSRDPGTDSNLNSAPGGRLIATNITIRELLRLAFGKKDYQIERAAGWIEGERFDISARTTDGKTTTLDDEKAQIRALLAERFALMTHTETKQSQIYELVVGKDGSRLTLHNDGSGSGTHRGCGHLDGTRLTLDTIATVLSRHIEQDVVNRTGLPGKYDFQLNWTPDTGTCPGAADQPSLFTAIQQQLGLKLEAAKGPVEFLIIDRVERPSPN